MGKKTFSASTGTQVGILRMSPHKMSSTGLKGRGWKQVAPENSLDSQPSLNSVLPVQKQTLSQGNMTVADKRRNMTFYFSLKMCTHLYAPAHSHMHHTQHAHIRKYDNLSCLLGCNIHLGNTFWCQPYSRIWKRETFAFFPAILQFHWQVYPPATQAFPHWCQHQLLQDFNGD